MSFRAQCAKLHVPPSPAKSPWLATICLTCPIVNSRMVFAPKWIVSILQIKDVPIINYNESHLTFERVHHHKD